jgi:Tfp pilus assembly protein PilE
MTTSPRGFTLLEALVYLALFSIMITGVASGAFSVIESSGRNQTRAMLQEEGNFIIGKIQYALAGASQVTAPATTGSTLTTTKYDSTSVTVSANGTAVDVKDEHNAVATTATNTNVTVENLTFTHTAASGDGINQESVTATFTLAARAPNGAPVSQDFTTTVYLRR